MYIFFVAVYCLLALRLATCICVQPTNENGGDSAERAAAPPTEEEEVLEAEAAVNSEPEDPSYEVVNVREQNVSHVMYTATSQLAVDDLVRRCYAMYS